MTYEAEVVVSKDLTFELIKIDLISHYIS